MNCLPELVLLEQYNGNWDDYLKAIYSYFCDDFVHNKPYYRGKKLALKRHPVILGKEATFWHLISEGAVEEDRTPDMRRCERIRWPKPIIEKSDTEPCIKVWETYRKNEKRICLWLEKEEYLVILAERKGYILLWTAFMVTRTHQKKKLQKQFEKANAAST